MSRRNRENPRKDGPAGPASSPGSSPLLVANLIGIGVLLVLTGLTWSNTQDLQKNVGKKFDEIQASVSQLSTKVESSARAAAAQQRPQGPDPNKVYAIKTAGAPVEGPANAAVTIAEFSDFQ
jgi:protein-disulfide isomerase